LTENVVISLIEPTNREAGQSADEMCKWNRSKRGIADEDVRPGDHLQRDLAEESDQKQSEDHRTDSIALLHTVNQKIRHEQTEQSRIDAAEAAIPLDLRRPEPQTERNRGSREEHGPRIATGRSVLANRSQHGEHC
jgi:hypothetical protein